MISKQAEVFIENIEPYSPKTFTLRKVPEDVYGYLIIIQAHEKEKCKCQKGFETIIHQLIRTRGKELEQEKTI